MLEEIVNLVPPPDDNDSKPLRALVFDSVYDSYRGVIVYVRIVDGVVRPGQTMRLMATGAEFTIVETGYMRAKSLEPTKEELALIFQGENRRFCEKKNSNGQI